MSKQTEVRKTQELVERKIETFYCDFCQTSTRDLENWEGDAYSIDGTSVRMESGSCYPDCGWKEITEFHICANCFKEKLIPFFKSHKIKPTKSEADW